MFFKCQTFLISALLLSCLHGENLLFKHVNQRTRVAEKFSKEDFKTLYRTKTGDILAQNVLENLDRVTKEFNSPIVIHVNSQGEEAFLPSTAEWAYRTERIIDGAVIDNYAEGMDTAIKALQADFLQAVRNDEPINRASFVRRYNGAIFAGSEEIKLAVDSPRIGMIEKRTTVLHMAGTLRDLARERRGLSGDCPAEIGLPPLDDDPLGWFSANIMHGMQDREAWGISPDLARLYHESSKNCAGITDPDGKIVGSGIFLSKRLFLTALHSLEQALPEGDMSQIGKVTIVRHERLSTGDIRRSKSDVKVSKIISNGLEHEPPRDFVLLETVVDGFYENPVTYTKKPRCIGERLFVVGYPFPKNPIENSQLEDDRVLLMRVRNNCSVLLPERIENLNLIFPVLLDFYNKRLSSAQKQIFNVTNFQFLDQAINTRFRNVGGIFYNFYKGSEGEMPSISLSGRIYASDSGAPVFEHRSGSFVGIVIRGRPDDQMDLPAFPNDAEEILPMHEIIKSIKNNDDQLMNKLTIKHEE